MRNTILGSGMDFDITIKEGAGAFVCGEATALIHSIEGQSGMPRMRSPYPSVQGRHGMLLSQHRETRFQISRRGAGESTQVSVLLWRRGGDGS